LKIIKITNKEKVIKEIEKGVEDEVVYLSIRPSIDVIVALLENDPNIRILLCSPSLYELTSVRVKNALKKVGISLEKGSFKVGRPVKYTKRDIEEIFTLYNSGVSVSKIAHELGIPRRTIYYYLDKVKNNELQVI
jgi:hypothetical protein